MIKGKNVWCAVPACTKKFNLEKRYFFRFPKEHERWLQWVRACGRLDLEPKGPEYAYQNCRLCHLHFKEKWYKINKMRARLHPDAIPTIFFGSECGKENTIDIDIEDKAEINKYIDRELANNITQEKNSNMESAEIQQKHLEKHMEIKTEVETNDNMESAETLPIIVDNMNTEIIKPNTSKHTKQDMKSSEKSKEKQTACEARKIEGTKQNAPRNNPTTPFEGKKEKHTRLKSQRN